MSSIVPSTGRSQASSYGTNGSRTSSLSVESPTLRSMPYSRPPSGYENGNMNQPMYPRTPYYEEDNSALYMPSPAYMLPSAESNGLPGFCASPGSPKTWNTVAQVAAATHINALPNGLYTDRDPSVSLGATSYPYLAPPLSQVSTSTDIPSLFPAMNSLNSNLSGSDRTLPNPATGRSQLFNNGAGATSSQSENSPCMPFAPGPLLGYKPSAHWVPDGMGSDHGQGSVRTMSNSAMSTNTPTDSKTSSPQDMGFGYIPISGSPPPEAMNSVAPYTGAEATDSSDGYHTSADPNQLCREGILSSDNCGSEVYGYSTERSGRRPATSCSSSSGTLINGQQYNRVPQSQPLGTSSFNILRTAGTPDFRPETAHLPSVTTLGNTAGY
ncbi:hypothetical protein FQN54_006838 [Arachnomyces sp. PD_36]|nr:hypothetical protein FQN54_006838 [Arachnomyces sp. PD_36]